MICSKSVAVLLLAVLVSVAVREGRSGSVRWPRIRPLNLDSSLPELSAYRETLEHSTVEEIIDELQVREMHVRSHTHMHMHVRTMSHTCTHKI